MGRELLKSIWHQIAFFLLIFLVGLTMGAYVQELKEFILLHSGIILIKYATWFTALTGVIFWLWQINQTRTKTEIEMALKMAEKFDSAQMIRHRIHASRALLISDSESNPSVDAILNFFEEIDFLLEKRAISDEVAWHFFAYWVLGYGFATQKYREEERSRGAGILVFSGTENIYKRLAKIERKSFRKVGGTYREIDGAEAQRFLEEESILEGEAEHFHIKARRNKGRVTP